MSSEILKTSTSKEFDRVKDVMNLFGITDAQPRRCSYERNIGGTIYQIWCLKSHLNTKEDDDNKWDNKVSENKIVETLKPGESTSGVVDAPNTKRITFEKSNNNGAKKASYKFIGVYECIQSQSNDKIRVYEKKSDEIALDIFA